VFQSGLAIMVAAVVVRFCRSRGVERTQLRWFAYVVAAAVGLVVLSLPLGAVNPDLGNGLAGVGFGVGLPLLLPTTIGLAIMRHGLYDIDVFIDRRPRCGGPRPLDGSVAAARGRPARLRRRATA
jgi:hypothetical protein